MQSMVTKQERAVLREALSAKLQALLDIEDASNNVQERTRKADQTEGNEIDNVFKELSQWVESVEEDYPVLYARHAARESR